MHLKSSARCSLLCLVLFLALQPTQGQFTGTSASRRFTNSPGFRAVAPPAPVPPRLPPAPTPSPELAARIKQTNTFFIPTNSFTTPERIPAKAQGKALGQNELLRLAARGNPFAQYRLGLCYLNGGQGVETNIEKARMMFELAAVQGDTNALNQLGMLKPRRPASESRKP